MTYKLTELIAASAQAVPGNILSGGKVLGLVATDLISAYKLGAATWTGEPAPYDIGILGPTHNSGAVVNVVATFAGYSPRYTGIRNSAASFWTNEGTLGNNNALITSATWDNGAGTVTLVYTLTGAYDVAYLPTLSSFTAWFLDYVNPAKPDDSDTGTYTVRAAPVTTAGGTPPGYDEYTSRWRFNNPDPGGFNPVVLSTLASGIRVNRRAYPAWATVYEVEYHSSNAYTNDIGRNVDSLRNTVHDWYVRYRIKAEYNGGTAGSWTNHGLLNWTDPRPDI